MAISFALSWLLNAALWAIVTGIIVDGKQYHIESKPWVPFLLVVMIPTLLEAVSYTFEQQPFLSVIWPAFAAAF